MSNGVPILNAKRIFTGLMLALGLIAGGASAQTISPAGFPLYFEANNSQTEFLSSGNGYQFLISASGMRIALSQPGEDTATAQMRFIGANDAARIRGGSEMTGKVNYLIGNNPSKWQTGLPTFGKVRVTELYPGINLIFHGNQRQLEYDFGIAPGADPEAIKMRFSGVNKISVTPEGDLILGIGTGNVRQPKPEIYQTIGGARKTVAGGYQLLGPETVAFTLGHYDHSLPLVIDPVLGYSTFFGGHLSETGWAIAVDTNDYLYLAGQTVSKGFATEGAYQTNLGGGTIVGDAFVAKFEGTPATNLIYLTYLGGAADDAAYGLAVDGEGNAFITGATESTNFPVTNAIPGHSQISGAKGSTGSYLADAFVAELDPSGSNLIYSTYLGGSSSDGAYGIALDSSDDAYITGFSYSTNFPVSVNALQTHLASTNGTTYLNANAFVSEITNGGGALVYSTYLGGTNYDVGRAIAVDTNNNVYVAGYTASFNFPRWNTPTNLPHGRYLDGVTNQSRYQAFDAFATKFPPLNGTVPPASQTNAFYSTLLGGTNDDMAYGIAADAAGNAYVTGWTASTNFPVINPPPGLSSFLTTNGNRLPVATNVFLTKIAADGSAVLNSSVFGGDRIDIGYGVAVDAGGDAFVVGSETSRTNFPTRGAFGSLLSTNSSTTGQRDAFVTEFNANWTSNYYSVCLGGKQNTYGYAIALDASTNVFITGLTSATNFPTQDAPSHFWFNGTNDIYGTNYINGLYLDGTTDAFVSEIILAPPVPENLAVEPMNETVGYGATATFAVSTTTLGQLFYQWQNDGTNLVNGGRIRGVTSSTLTITNAQPGDSGTNYAVIVMNSAGTATNSGIALTVLNMPYLLTVPTNQILVPGTTMKFSVTASGSPLFYLWSTNDGYSGLTNGSNFRGVTNSTLTISNAQPSDAGTYTVYVYNYITPYTNVSAILADPLSIVTAPTNQTGGVGSTVSFTVVADGAPLSYQWTNNGAPALTNDNVSGAFSSTLTITDAQPSEAGNYTVTVSNGIQSTNLSATLTIVPGFSITGFTPVEGGSKIVLSGKGGVSGGPYYILTSSNLMIPVTNWTPIATDQFDSQGQFIFTNPVQTNLPASFFLLKQP